MQSSVPNPGNPWPHAMVITVEDEPRALHELLWVREAWRLLPAMADPPPLLAHTPATIPLKRRHGVDLAPWESAWVELWQECVAHTASPQGRDLTGGLAKTPSGSDERRALLARLRGPSWRDRFGDDSLGEECAEWKAAMWELRKAERESHRGGGLLAASPEHAVVADLVPAWEAGLTRIVVLRCDGDYTRRIGPEALLVTAATRADLVAYAWALSEFPRL